MATNFHSSTLQRCWRALGRRRLESCSSSGMRAEKALRDGPVILGRNLLTYLMCLLGVPQPADCIGAGARAAPTLPPRPKPQPGVLVFTCMCACARARVCVCLLRRGYRVCTTLLTALRILSNGTIPSSPLFPLPHFPAVYGSATANHPARSSSANLAVCRPHC